MPNLLILEDHPAWEAIIANAVRNADLPECNVHPVQTCAEAVGLIQRETIHVGLLDYRLGQSRLEGPKTGLDVAQVLRSATPNAAIILITVIDTQEVRLRCDELGVVLINKGRGDLEDEIVREIREGLADQAA